MNNDNIEEVSSETTDEMVKFLEWQEYSNKLLIASTAMLGIPVKYFGS